MLALLLDEGLPEAAADLEPLAAISDVGERHRLLERVDGRIRLTTEGRLLSNELFSRLV